LLLPLLASLAGCSRPDDSHQVELVTKAESPTPTMTFELRFDAAMVKGNRVGLPTTNSPLVIEPPLAGNFTWQSSRSGILTPTEPLRLDSCYVLSLRPGLYCADGTPSQATLHWTVQTPPFGVTAAWPKTAETNAHSTPKIKFAFNADVNPADAARYICFRNAAGQQVAADVYQGAFANLWYYYGSDSGSVQTWKQQAADLNPPDGKAHRKIVSHNPDDEVPNLLVATPQHALPVGNDWKLVVSPGLPAADRTLVSRAETIVPVGDITPFAVQQVETHYYLNGRPSVRLEFSKPIPASLTNRFPDWITLSDTPTNLQAQVRDHVLTLSGDFTAGTTLTLRLLPGFPAVEPFALSGTNEFQLDIPHIAPRLYFPSLSSDQLAGGHRTLPLLAVNVSRIHLRAKLMDPATAIHALRGYHSYLASSQNRRDNDDWYEPYRQIDYNVLPGTTVLDTMMIVDTNSDSSDVAQKLNLEWDKILGGRRAGVVFLDARAFANNNEDNLPGTQTLIQLTDLGLVWKKSATGVDAFVFSHTTAQPVAGTTVRLLGSENQTLRESVTDTNGLAHLTANTNGTWLAALAGEDFHAEEFDHDRVWPYQFHLPFAGVNDNDTEKTRRVMIFSDRDLYRPGEAMHLEAIVRDWNAAGLSVPPQLTGSLQCRDARDRVFFETNAAFSPLGSWSTLVPLPVGSRGDYSARLHLGTDEETNFYSFQVRDFQPSAFEIALPFRPSYRNGDAIQLPLSARYLFGKALSHADVVWSLQADDLDFRPEKFDAFSFRRCDLEMRHGRGRSSLILSGRGTLTATNPFIIAPELSINPAAPQPRTVSLLAEVTDLNQQTLSRRAEFVYHSSDFYLGLRQANDVLSSNLPPALEVAAVGSNGKPWPETVSAHLTLRRIDWQSVRLQGAGKTIRFRNEAVFTNLLERDITVAPVPASGTNDDDNHVSGNSITNLPPLPAGEYLVEVRAADQGNRPVVSSLNFEVTAEADLGWNYHDEVSLTLKPNQKEYAPGDTAEVLVEAPFSGTALVTVERERVLRSFVTQLTGSAPSIHIPIEPGDVPNVFVAVTLLRGADQSPHQAKEPEYRLGACLLPVMDSHARLTVTVTPTSTNNLPGQSVEATVLVTDAAHQPAPGAEVILYAVDDGILGLTGYALPDPLGFFYATRPLSVVWGISLPNLLAEDPDELSFANKGFLGGGGGRERIRKNFLACAFWNATLRTDSDGRVQVRFPAPDSLTRYRLFAVAHTADNHFGGGQSAFHITKPLVIEPALPPFANITDRLVARAVVLNQTTNAGEVMASLSLDDKAQVIGTNTLSRRVSIAANGSAVVEFPVEFTDTGTAQWIWRAQFSEPATVTFADAVQSTLPVGHIAPVLGEVLLSRATTLQTNLLTVANPQLLAGRGTLTVSVANTRLNELGEAAAQLLHYPYGCAEQTGSSLLPWILLRDAPGLLPAQLGAATNDSAAAIRSGVARLISMQTRSGGLGYWPRDKEPMLWASAYGGMVLALARQHHVSVPNEDFESLMNYLSAQLRSGGDDSKDRPDRCLALYALALAGKAEPAYHEKLYATRAELSPEDRALLALAIAESQGSTAMIAELLRDSSSGPHPFGRFGCLAREKAIRLLAWIHYRPNDPTVDGLASDLVRDQKQAHWGTTQGNAWALLALTEYARRVEIERRPAAGQLAYAGQSIAFQLNEHTNVFTQVFTITNLADAALSLSNTTTNCLYTTLSIEARPPETAQPRLDRGFNLQRRYERLDDHNQPQDLAALRVGDRVLVTLRLTVHEAAEYVAIDDALPSVLEAVNADFRTQGARAVGLADDESWWPADFQEIRQDRCLSFADELEPGIYVLRYLARVRAAGTVTAPPAKVEEMYHPEHCGFTETQTIVSESLN
jgi:uncharacterized protein YfaS (alpha-2-macroglobulin family)